MLPGHEPKRYGCDQSEQSITADCELKQFAVFVTRAAKHLSLRVDEPECFDVRNQRLHFQAAAMNVRRQTSAKRECVRPSLLLGDAPSLLAVLLRGQVILDQFGPLNARFRFD